MTILSNCRVPILFCLLAVTSSTGVLARQNAVDLTSQRQSTSISMMGVYQSYEEDGLLSMSQLSFPLVIDVPLGRKLRLNAWANRMETEGEGVQSLSGFSDAQVILSFAQPVGSGSLVLSMSANVPTGQSELTTEEFETVILLSQAAYDYRVPSLGQGLGVSPSVTWAFPVAPSVVAGIGASFQHRGSYKPLDSLEEEYVPGDEVLLTVGLDARLSRTTALSLDMTYAIYAADRLGDEDIYQAGNKITSSVLIRGFQGFNEWRLLGLYRNRTKSDELAGSSLVTEEQRTVPNEIMLRASYGLRVTSVVTTTLQAEIHFFDETEIYPKRSVIDLGLIPSFRISPRITFLSRVVATIGTVSGFEAGAGLSVTL
ncbi:MAG: hypothetical protein ACI80V_000916 [Rhodothermales bacterium]|jgi:hypothetical protein